MKKDVPLGDREIEGLAYYFAFWWAVVVLNPRNQQTIRDALDADRPRPPRQSR
mgnify:CR=1 FL=1